MKPLQNQSVWLNNLPFLMLPPLFWAGNFVVGKVVSDEVPPFTLAFGRWVLAFIVLLPFAWPHVRRDWALYGQNLPRIAATAVVGVMAFNTLIYKGLHDTTTTNALLLNSCIPVLIILFGRLFYGQKLKGVQALGLAVSLSGVLAIVLQGEMGRLLTLSFNPGDLWVFSAMVCWAFYTLWTKALPPQINKIGLTAVQIVLAVAVLLPLFLWEQASGQAVVWNRESLLGLAYIGIFPSVAAYLLYSFAVARVGAVKAGLSIHLMPVFGVLLSVGLLGEAFQIYHALGIGLIAAGLVLCHRAD